MLLRGSVVLVTGASRGIGAATARLLAARGAQVVCTGRDAAALHAVADPIGASVVVADLADPAAPQRVVSFALAEHGRLDGLVANAGVGYAGEFAAMAPERVVELVDVNVRAVALLALAAVAAVKAGSPTTDASTRGGLVLVSSIAGAVGVPGETVYSATKTAVDAFAATLREELRDDRITVSAIAPGVVDTEFFERRGAPYDRSFPRPISADRVAAAVVRALESGADRIVEPRWLRVPAGLAAVTPRLYRRLARRFG
jgi:short-subunit dehydrogenase